MNQPALKTLIVAFVLLSSCTTRRGLPAISTPQAGGSGVPTPTAMEPTPTPEFKHQVQLTFVSDRHPGYSGVYAVNILCWEASVDCYSVPELMFELPQRIMAVAWSPDGRQAAIEVHHEDGTSDILLAGPDGSDLNFVTSGGGLNSFPAWAPDGNHIVFTYAASPAPRQLILAQIEPRAISPIRLPDNVGSVLQADWAPDGRHLAISAHTRTEFPARIFIISADGKSATPLTKPPADGHGDFVPAYSPDGLDIAYVGSRLSGETFRDDVYVMNVATGQVVALTSDIASTLDPAWAPIGSWLGFASNKTGDYEIYVIRPDGTDRRNVSNSPARDISPAWRVTKH